MAYKFSGSFGKSTRSRSLIVMPGVTIKNARVNFLLCGCRTALTVCQAMSIAMTVVLPEPVASLSASRDSGEWPASRALSRYSRNRFPSRTFGATSLNQMMVSTASIWQKNGRGPWKSCSRQYSKSRAVSGETCQVFGSGRVRHLAISRRSSSIRPPSSSCCFSVDSSFSVSAICLLLCFFGLGIGVRKRTGRRPASTRCVGSPSASSSQCSFGTVYGEFRIGLLKNL